MTKLTQREEQDSLGKKEIPAEYLYGIHSQRARENFPLSFSSYPFSLAWYKAIGVVKLACYFTYENMLGEFSRKYGENVAKERMFPLPIIRALISAAKEISQGNNYGQFIVPAISGGAGTSINMNINEIITNLALQTIGEKCGNYSIIDPIEHANIFQSTNDVIPTALKVAVVNELTILEDNIAKTRVKFEELEKKYSTCLRLGYTQMQAAVPTSFGKLFGSYAEALGRDWWRVSKCFERIKVVNLGGNAIGTGIAVPKYFIFEVVNTLQKLTNKPFTRAEHLPDATSNLDSLVEIHAILKAHAVTLEKIVADFRLLSSDLSSIKYLKLPAKQVGSSFMPGKINPVIPEFIISCAHKIYVNDILITSLSAQGCLELNAYLPTIGHYLLESIELMQACNSTLQENMLNELEVNTDSAVAEIFKSTSVTTILLPFLGYNKASEIAKFMQEKNIDIFAANLELSFIAPEKLSELLQPENLLQLGFTYQFLSLKKD